MPPKKKTAGLAAFADQQSSRAAEQAADRSDRRTKAKKETVAVTLRLSRDQWERVHQLARAEGVSLNQLALEGLSRLFEEKGLQAL
jgi:transposase InsO family protein